jgi:hypothetical protein
MKVQKLTYTRIFMGLSQFVCGGVWGVGDSSVVVKYFPYLYLLDTLFQVMQVSDASWKSLISGLTQGFHS